MAAKMKRQNTSCTYETNMHTLHSLLASTSCQLACTNPSTSFPPYKSYKLQQTNKKKQSRHPHHHQICADDFIGLPAAPLRTFSKKIMKLWTCSWKLAEELCSVRKIKTAQLEEREGVGSSEMILLLGMASGCNCCHWLCLSWHELEKDAIVIFSCSSIFTESAQRSNTVVEVTIYPKNGCFHYCSIFHSTTQPWFEEG